MRHLKLLILFALIIVDLPAQWNSTYVGYNGGGFSIKYITRSQIAALQSESIPVGKFFHFRLRSLRSVNGGSSWAASEEHYDQFQSYTVTGLSFCDTSNGIFAVRKTSGGQNTLYRTTNGGGSYVQSAVQLSNGHEPVSAVLVNPSVILILTMYGTQYDNNFLLRSTNGGTSWSTFQTGFTKEHRKIVSEGNSLYICGDSGMVLKSTDTGTTWSLQSTGYHYTIWDVSFRDNMNGLACGGTSQLTHIYRTTNGGASWQLSANLPLVWAPRSITFRDPLTAYASSDKIIGTTDGGNTWLWQAGLSSFNSAISMLNKDTAICFNQQNVYRTFTGIVTGFQPAGSEIPNGFALYQNYPNPFNPVTNIKFGIPLSSQTELVISDMLGRELYKEENYLPAGSYEFKWDAANYSSGIYFYKITAEGYTETKKMILLK